MACTPPDEAEPKPPPVQALTKPYTGEDAIEYFGAPWPDDRRFNADGTIPLNDVPNPMNGGLFDSILRQSTNTLKGWGLASPIYLPFSGPIDVSTLPQTPTKDASASVYLMVIDPSSPYLGQRTFIDFKFFEQATLFVRPNVLASRPKPGFPLEPRTKYALVVTTALKDTTGQSIAPDADFKAVLDGSASEAERSHYAPLLAELARQNIAKETVSAAVVFTTQPMFEELTVLRDFLLNFEPAPAMDMTSLKVITEQADLDRIWDGAKPANNFWILEGTYKAPYMQHGTRPFLTEGGNFKYDANGKPIPAFVEDMRISICLPKTAPPANGFPPVFYSHGTGGTFEHAVKDICADLAERGIIVFGIDQVLTGPRAGGADELTGCFGQEVANCFFNYANPVAVRANIQQAALDNVSLRRMVSTLVIPASIHPDGLTVKVDASKLGFFGHSQGGLTGALYAAVEPELQGATLSGAGGHLTTSILYRKAPDAKTLAEGPLFLNIAGVESLEPYHPALAVAQMLVDIADPLNYARYWFKRPIGRAKHIYATSGLRDQFTVADAAEAMAVAAGLPQLIPVGRQSDVFALAGLAPLPTPATMNATSEDGKSRVTAVFRQFPKAGHYPVFDDKTARQQWAKFFESMFADDKPVVPKPIP
jgi:pimeloyl-ACP methyl ester carboxylesterase